MGNQHREEQDIYTKAALLWTGAFWGWLDEVPRSGVLQKTLREVFSERELEALVAIPVKPVPIEGSTLEEVAARSEIPAEELQTILDSLVERGLLFSPNTKDGRKGYAVLSRGFGFPQVFYWKGEKTHLTRKIAELENDPDVKASSTRMVTELTTKPYRYVPVTEAVDSSWQNVYPTDTIEKVIEKADRLALAHCPCRVKYEVLNDKSCGHATDNCIKMNELAACVIEAGLAREISREEALLVVRKASADGLVHFVDNTGEDIQHICNCCGCACWNVGPIRRRQVPRDVLMATYFVRETDASACTGCEACVDVCPVEAVRMEDGVARADLDWCIGCGVCAPKCPVEAIRLVEKGEKPIQTASFAELRTRITNERAAVRGRGD